VSEIHRLALRLRDERISRNRNFDELSQPAARRARRLLKRLAGLERELRAGGAVRVRPHDDGYIVTIEFPSVRARRVAFLTREERELLATDTALRPLLEPEAG
jgi:hypothetical protein